MGLDNLPEIPPCEFLMKKVDKNVERIDFDKSRVSPEILEFISVDKEKPPEEVYVSHYTDTKHKYDSYILNSDHPMCDVSVCPFQLVKHWLGILGSPCWLRGKVYNYVVEQLTGYSLYEDLEPDDIYKISEVFEKIVNHYEKVREGKDVLRDEHIHRLYYDTIMILDEDEKIESRVIEVISKILYEIKNKYDEYIEEKFNYLTSNEVVKLRLELMKNEIEGNDIKEIYDMISEGLSPITKKFNDRIDKIFDTHKDELVDLGVIDNTLTNDEYTEYDSFKETILQIIELYYYFKAFKEIGYDKKLIAWY